MNQSHQPCWGKYRGLVTDNNDPDHQGRIRAEVQDILGANRCGWASPAVPYAGKSVGLCALPPVNSWVWIEYEHGDPERPVWTGCFWDSTERPAEAKSPAIKLFKTDKATITVDDQQGSLTLQLASGPKIELSGNGIKLDNGKGATVELTGNSVKINGSALEVT